MALRDRIVNEIQGMHKLPYPDLGVLNLKYREELKVGDLRRW